MVAVVRKIRRLGEGGHGGGPNSFQQQIEIRLPNWRMIQLAARSILLTVAIISFPWWGTTAIFRNAATDVGLDASSIDITDAAINGPGAAFSGGAAVLDDVYFLPMLLRDLKREGVFSSSAGQKVLFLGDGAGHLRLPFLKQNKIEVISDENKDSVPVNSVDFIFTLDTSASDFADRVLKIGGVAAVRLSSNPSEPFRMPPNYNIIYIRRFGSTIVAMRKTASSAGDGVATGTRKLLSVILAKKEAMSGLEDVLLEPPRTSSGRSKKYLRRTKYLPDLMGDTLDGYPRRVFIDVGPPGSANVKSWLTKHYPTRNRQFEMIRVETTTGGGAEVVAAAEGAVDEEREDEDEDEDEMSWWLRRNVREEDYVVMKAEAEAVEALVRSRAIGLVDELFLECRHQWQKGGKSRQLSRRAYWECLALYGKLLDEGVAVHQWWG